MKNNKKILFSLIAMTLFAVACEKDPGVSPGGGTYYPPATPTPVPYVPGPVQCYNSTSVNLSRAQSGMLCSGSPGSVTVTACYNNTPTSLPQIESSLLCAGAYNNAPVSCYNSTPTTMSKYDSAILCSGANSNSPYTSCYQSTSTTLSTANSVVLCSGASSTLPIGCYNNTPLSLSAESSAILCSNAVSAYASTDCYANTPVSLDKYSSAILCQQAPTANGPVNCYQGTPTTLGLTESAILCSGSNAAAGYKAAAIKCYESTPTSLSKNDSAILCSGVTDANWQEPMTCYNSTSVSLSRHDAAVLCSKNTSLLVTAFGADYYYATGRMMATSSVGTTLVTNSVSSSSARVMSTNPVMASVDGKIDGVAKTTVAAKDVDTSKKGVVEAVKGTSASLKIATSMSVGGSAGRASDQRTSAVQNKGNGEGKNASINEKR